MENKNTELLRQPKTLAALALLVCILAAIAIFFSLESRAPSAAATPFPGQIGPAPVPTSYVSNVGGTISAIGTNQLTVSSEIPGQPSTTTTVSVGSDTSIFKEVPIDQKTFEAEQSAFLEATASSTATSTPPLPYTKQSLALSDLKTGTLVSISLAPQKDSNGMMHALEIGVLPMQP